MASWLAWRALSAFCRTVDSCSMEAEVCSSALAGLLFGAGRQVVVSLGNFGTGVVRLRRTGTLLTMVASLPCMAARAWAAGLFRRWRWCPAAA